MLLSSGFSETGFQTFLVFLKYTWLLAEMLMKDKDAIGNVFTGVHCHDDFILLCLYKCGELLLFKS